MAAKHSKVLSFPATPRVYSYIRMSTPEQLKGDSLRRQLEYAANYAKERGLPLDDTTKLHDIGISAFNGEHRTRGALAGFLNLIRQGRVAPGSVLVVESLDRLSREGVMTAFRQFSEIIEAGVTIVTAADNQVYDQANLDKNFGQLIMSITIMARAHDESETKSKRIKAAWERKREQAATKKLTAKCPAWLKLSDDRTRFEVIPEVTEAVRAIFHKKLKGKSSRTIARELNEDPGTWKPPKGGRNKTGGWRKSYVEKLLRSRAVIGEFQPHRKVKGRREPVGDPIPSYYPTIVEPEMFYEVQALMRARARLNGRGGGKTGKAHNLFVHLAKCGICGSAMHLVDKGKPPKGRRYLVCDAARRLRTHEPAWIVYDEFEKLFFNNFEELDIRELLPEHEQAKKETQKLNRTIISLEEQLKQTHERIQNLTEAIADERDKNVRNLLQNKLRQTIDQQSELRQSLSNAQEELERLLTQETSMEEEARTVLKLHDALRKCTSEQERIELRIRIRNRFQSLLEWIKIYPQDEPFVATEEIEPGVIKWVESKTMKKVRIRFKGVKKLRILNLVGKAEVDG